MQKKVLPYIEDYIEVLGGYLGIKGKDMTYSLARYDVQIVHSLAEQTNKGIGYTDRQALLAHKLVVKYKKQFAKHHLDIGFHEDNGHFRLPVRFVDRGKTIRLNDGIIEVRFPYSTEMIDYLRETGKNIPGHIHFDKDKKAWLCTITEPRLLWLEQLANKYNFDISVELENYINQVKDCKTTPYQIVLVKNESGYSIENASDSLTNYVVENLGGFGDENVLRLIDNSSILGYQVSDEIRNVVKQEFNFNQQTLLGEREIHLPITNNSALSDIVEYAGITNRWPIYVFENNDVSDVRIKPILSKHFSPDDVLYVSGKPKELDVSNKKCVYINNWNQAWKNKIPLLVTMTSMMIGPKKQFMLQNSDKVVYCTDILIKYKI